MNVSASSIPCPSGAEIIRQIKAATVQFVAAVPDIVTSEGLLWPIARDPSLRLLRLSREDEGVSVCAAMSYNGTRAVLLMQQTGLMDSLNAIRAIAVDYQLPVVMLVGLQGKEPHCLPEYSSAYGVRIVIPVLESMNLRYSLIAEPEHVHTIRRQIDLCYRKSCPHVFLVGRSPGLK